MKPERKNYPQLDAPVGAYVHAVKCNGLLFISGLTAFGSAAQGHGIAEEADVILNCMAKIAASEKTDLGALVKVTIFVTDMGDIGKLREVLFRHYGGNLPASSLVEVSRLFSPDICIEMEAILAV